MIQVTLSEPATFENTDNEIVSVGGCSLGLIAGTPPRVLFVEAGSELSSQGIQTGDLLVIIDGTDVSNMVAGELLRFLRGASRFEFRRTDGEAQDVSMDSEGGGSSGALAPPRMEPPPRDIGMAPALSKAAAAAGVVTSAAIAEVADAASTIPALSKAVSKASTLTMAAALGPPKASGPAMVPPPGPGVVAPPGKGGVPYSKQPGLGVPFQQHAMGIKGKGGGRGTAVAPRIIPPRPGAPAGPVLLDPNDHRESLPAEQEMEAWLELLRDGHCSQMRWQNSCPEPPPFHRAMQCAADAGGKIPEGKYPRDALNLQFQLLIGMRPGAQAVKAGGTPPLALGLGAPSPFGGARLGMQLGQPMRPPGVVPPGGVRPPVRLGASAPVSVPPPVRW